jgi:SulP family sulfate permease
LFYYLPNAILAAVIMVAVFGLIDYKEPIHLWHTDRSDFWMLIVTFVATLSLGIEQGIGIGVILSLAMMIFRSTRPHMVELGQVPGAKIYRNLDRFSDLEKREDILIVRFDAQLYFANINFFQDRMSEMIQAKGDQLRAIIINAESIGYMDSSALHALEEFVKKYKSRNIKIFFTGVIGPVRDALTRGHLLEEIGKDRLLLTVQQAVDQIDGEGNPKELNGRLQNYTLQTNE